MNMGEHVSEFARRMMKPPGWPMYSLVAVAALVSVWAAASPMPAGSIGSVVLSLWYEATDSGTGWKDLLLSPTLLEVRYLYAFIAWGLAAVFWVVRRVIRGATVRRVARRRPATLAYWRRWLLPHFVLAAVVVFCMTPAPAYMGFWASKAGIERARREGTLRREVWRGVFPIDARAQPWWARASPNELSVSPWGGFVYSPAGRPIDARYHNPRYMGAGWYSFERGGGW
jgi:hypothetical protein